MSHKAFPFKEEVLHKLWVDRMFVQEGLCTTSGEQIKVLNPGALNPTDGPDFLHAKIKIGPHIHFGAIELHIKSRDWYAHNHHIDKKYRNVILHVVVYSGLIKPAETIDKDEIPTLNLFSALSGSIKTLIQSEEKPELACSKLIPFISPEAFRQQIQKAHLEYLEKKVRDFYSFFDEREKLAHAWKNALILSLFDGFGVPYNREQMKEAAKRYLYLKSMGEFEKSLFVSSQLSGIQWNYKAVHPGNRPTIRVRQLLEIGEFISHSSLSFFLDNPPELIWETLLAASSMKLSKHNHRMYIAFILPAMYALGSLVQSKRLMESVVDEWEFSEVEVPKSILRKFGVFEADNAQTTIKQIGLIHQFNSYCRVKRCLDCKVLNNAISS